MHHVWPHRRATIGSELQVSREQFLFVSSPIRVRMDQLQRSAFDQIQGFSSDVILSKTVDEWVNELAEKYRIQVPTIDPNNCYTTDHEGQVPLYQLPNPNFGDTSPMVPGKFFMFHFPYVGDETMFYDRPMFTSAVVTVPVSLSGHQLDLISGPPLDCRRTRECILTFSARPCAGLFHARIADGHRRRRCR
jgi:hypothetical protein